MTTYLIWKQLISHKGSRGPPFSKSMSSSSSDFFFICSRVSSSMLAIGRKMVGFRGKKLELLKSGRETKKCFEIVNNKWRSQQIK